MNTLLLSIVLTLGLQACDPGPESPVGFSLPKGDAVEGEKVLGGTSIRVTTYADLVTSVINPSHKLARNYQLALIQHDGVSKMLVFNDVMTVTELINLVTFLQPKYKVPHYEYTYYGPYEIE